MKKLLFTVTFGALLTANAVVPTIKSSSVTMTQDPSSRKVTIAYTLEGDPAVVTVDIRTNGVSIGGANLSHFAGDVHRLVQPGNRTMTWMPHKAWPGNVVEEGVTAVVTAWATNTPPNYMVIPLDVAAPVHYYASAEEVPYGVTNDMYKGEYLVMRKIPAANVRWRMGSPSTEPSRWADREVAHEVTLSDDFYIGIYEFTQRQYLHVMGLVPSTKNLPFGPVEHVSWDTLRGTSVDWPENGHTVAESSMFDLLRKKCGGIQFDLPTDAQWEFACRAGVGTGLYNGEEVRGSKHDDALDTLCMYAFNACGVSNQTVKAGCFLPNNWGLYDMYGNVYEMCLDKFQLNLLNPAVADPNVGPTSVEDASLRVNRGGAYNEWTSVQRSAFRISISRTEGIKPNFGFRVCAPAYAIQ